MRISETDTGSFLTEKQAGYQVIEVERPAQEHCGIVAFYNFASISTPEIIHKQFDQLVKAGAQLQHRGPHGAGAAIRTDSGIRRITGKGGVATIFTDDRRLEVGAYTGTSWSVFQTRYGTSGGYGEDNLQPCIASMPDGESVVVVHNGEFAGVNQIRKTLLPTTYPEDISDTYLFTQLLAQTPGATNDEKVITALTNVIGAISIAIGIGEVLYVAKGSSNTRPLAIGKIDGNFIAASETVALDSIGAKTLREVRGGEIIRVDREGPRVLQKGNNGQGNPCDMEDEYFSKGDSRRPTYENQDDYTSPERWIRRSTIRERAGRIVAQEHPIRNADFVVGIPESGVTAALAYAEELGLTYQQVITKIKNVRSFLGDDHPEMIQQVVLDKLLVNTNKEIWEGKKVVLVDDSIIRGSSSIVIAQLLYSLGVAEMHFVSAYPQVRFSCHSGISIRSDAKLIAKDNADDATIANRVKEAAKIPSTYPLYVHYISPYGWTIARHPSGKIVIPKDPDNIGLMNEGCLGCVTGKYPFTKEGVIFDPRNTLGT